MKLMAGIVLAVFALAASAPLQARSRGGNPSGVILVPAGNGRFIPQGVGPFLYDPNHTLYDWEIKDGNVPDPCYYDAYSGQWLGRCNISLDQPGYSITVPNRIRR